MEKINVLIVGGGVVGCAIARELSKVTSDVFVIEKNEGITKGENQSSRNSGVIHAGIYYSEATQPLKAKLCSQGNELLYKFCEEYKIPNKKCGKIVVATKKYQEEYLENLLDNAKANCVPARKISFEEVKDMEPNVNCISAAHFPTSGIVDQTALVRALFNVASEQGTFFLTGRKVVNIIPTQDSFEVTVEAANFSETFKTNYLINSAGLYSDEIARMINHESHYEIVPVRGEYACFYKSRKELSTCMSVYPVPLGNFVDTGDLAEVSFKEFQNLLKQNKVHKNLGIHLTPTLECSEGTEFISDTVLLGPTSTVNVNKEDYSNFYEELHYLNNTQSFFPNLKIEDVKLHQTGIRSTLKNKYDFIIEKDKKHPKCMNLLGINSPGLTASLAIAKHVVTETFINKP